MTEYSRPSSFDFGAATLQGFNLPGGRGYLIRVAAWTAVLLTILYGADVSRNGNNDAYWPFTNHHFCVGRNGDLSKSNT